LLDGWIAGWLDYWMAGWLDFKYFICVGRQNSVPVFRMTSGIIKQQYTIYSFALNNKTLNYLYTDKEVSACPA